MTTITTRGDKGSPLTWDEADANFTNLNTDKLEDTDLSGLTVNISTTGTISGTIDHTALQNIGSNTHAQIDTHVADATLHFTEGSIDHGSIAGLGDDDHTHYVLADGSRDITGSLNIDGVVTADGVSVEGSLLAAQSDAGTDAFAAGPEAGLTGQGDYAIAIGSQAGEIGQGANALAFGILAGQYNQGGSSIAIGNQAGQGSTTPGDEQGSNAIAIGYKAGETGQSANAVALGRNAGTTSQGERAIAAGYNAGNNTQGSYGIAVGYFAGETSQGAQAIALGRESGKTSQGDYAIGIGYYAGNVSQSFNAIAIGQQAGETGQGTRAIAIGEQAGEGSATPGDEQGDYAVAVGYQAGETGQGDYAIAQGHLAGQTSQGVVATAIGSSAGQLTQGDYAVALGGSAGNDTQGAYAVALGREAGQYNQGLSSVAIGYQAGEGSATPGDEQGDYAVAVGYQAGETGQADYAIGMGYGTGQTSQGIRSVAIGYLAGQTSQGANAIGIGNQAGKTSQGLQSVAIGFYAGNASQSDGAVAIGQSAGQISQGAQATALGRQAGETTQGAYGTAIGYLAGATTQSGSATAIGTNAGRYNQGVSAVAIGHEAGVGTATPGDEQGDYAVAIGLQAGEIGQGNYAIAQGSGAGQTTQGTFSIAIGGLAGETNQSNSSVALGRSAGRYNQGDSSVALGYQAGEGSATPGDEQGSYAIAIGLQAGEIGQGDYSIAQGHLAGQYNQGLSAVAIGDQAGEGSATPGHEQGDYAIAVGFRSGETGQADYSIAMGYLAGLVSQAGNSIALGRSAGQTAQGTFATAIGYIAGSTSQSQNAIAIGALAGQTTQGTNAIALGSYAGQTSQGANGIILNATGSALDDTTAGHVHIASSLASLDYDGTDWSLSGGNFGIGTTSPQVALDVSGTAATIRAVGTSATDPSLTLSSAGITAWTQTVSGTDSSLSFSKDSSEKMRIDTSGNLLVGKTAVDTSVAGTVLSSAGYIFQTRDSAAPLLLRRNTVDGSMAEFYKDGSAVGSIGAYAGDIYIGDGDTGLRFNAENDFVLPFNATNGILGTRDAAINLGTTGGRFKDLYLSGNVYASSIQLDADATTTNAFQIEADTVTTGNVIDVANADALTTGGIADFVSNSADTGTRSLVKIHNDNAAAVNATALEITQDSTGNALDVTGDTFVDGLLSINNAGLAAQSLNVSDSGVSGTLAAFQHDNAAAGDKLLQIRLGNIVAGNVDVLTLSGATSSGDLQSVVQNNDNGNAVTVHRVLGTGDAFSQYEINGGQAWVVGLDNSDSDSFKISGSSNLGTNDYLTIDTSGNVGIGDTTPTAKLHVSDATAPTIKQTRTDTGQTWTQVIDSSGRFGIQEAASESGTFFTRFVIDDTGEVGIGLSAPTATLHVDSPATTTNAFQIEADTVTTGNVIDVANADALTTGSIADFVSNSADTGTRSLVKIHNDNALATNTTPLEIINDSSGPAIDVSTTGVGINVDSTTAILATFGRNGTTVVNILASSTTGQFSLQGSLGANLNLGRENSTGEFVMTTAGTSIESGTEILRIDTSSNVQASSFEANNGYTVAGLPAGTVGQIARITDGDAALAHGATAVNSGAGATPYLVWYNGTNWTILGT